MTLASLRTAALLAALAFTVACKGPAVPHPMSGQTRHLCCNLHYEKPEVSDVNFLKGTLVPVGTRVQILEVRRNSVKFQPDGHPAITAVLKYAKNGLPMDTFMSRLFVEQDPRARLPRAGRKGGGDAERVRKLIESGTVDTGMTREQVIMALGYPPAHRTPSLESPAWTYWQNRWVTMVVYFDGDRVSRVQR